MEVGRNRRWRRQWPNADAETNRDPDAATRRSADSPASFEHLYTRYGDAIARYRRVRIDDPAEAEDTTLVFANALARFNSDAP